MNEMNGRCQTSCEGLDFEAFLDPAAFRALSDTTRLALLGRLATARKPLTVSDAASCCGVHLSGVSRHLKILHDAGLVTVERQGREVRYQLRCQALVGALRALADALDCCATTVATGEEKQGTTDSKGVSK